MGNSVQLSGVTLDNIIRESNTFMSSRDMTVADHRCQLLRSDLVPAPSLAIAST